MPFEEANENNKPIAYWDMETRVKAHKCVSSGPGGCYEDLSGNGNHMEAVNWEHTGPYTGSQGCAMEGGCAETTSCSSHFRSMLPFPPSLDGARPKSISLFFNLGAMSGDGDRLAPIVGFGSNNLGNLNSCDDGGCRTFGLVAYSDQHGTGRHGFGSIGCNCDTWGNPGTRFKANQWHHGVITYDGAGSDSKVYLDGELVATRAAILKTGGVWRPFVLGTDTWWRGHHHHACYARYDEVRIYDYALSESQSKLGMNERTQHSMPTNPSPPHHQFVSS